MIHEPFRNDSGTIPRSLRTSRARADQGAGSKGAGRWIREQGDRSLLIPNLRSAPPHAATAPTSPMTRAATGGGR